MNAKSRRNWRNNTKLEPIRKIYPIFRPLRECSPHPPREAALTRLKGIYTVVMDEPICKGRICQTIASASLRLRVFSARFFLFSSLAVAAEPEHVPSRAR